MPLDELRTLDIRAGAAVWDAHDWCDMFVGITHVAGLETPGESVLDALKSEAIVDFATKSPGFRFIKLKPSGGLSLCVRVRLGFEPGLVNNVPVGPLLTS